MENPKSPTQTEQDLLDYNYRHFRPDPSQLLVLEGVQIGEPAPDFTASRLDGSAVSLSDFRGKYVVLETGSASCPQYVSRIEAMNALAYRFPDVVFLVLYVREAHPGGHLQPHRNADEKSAAARIAVGEEREGRTILIDDVAGAAHRRYGCMPNTVHLIDPDGIVVFRALWNDPAAVETALCRVRSGDDPATVQARFRPAPAATTVRVLRRAGWQAAREFAVALPRLVAPHLRPRR